jgi:cysteine sulfinate desulfinase/cysteine desulfurase-like protein
MNREIGSIFQINREDFGYGSSLSMELVSQAQHAGYVDSCAVSSGRDALELAILQIQKNRQDQKISCMLPMFTCDSVDAPFDYYDCEIYYYPIKKNLQPDAQVFSRIFEKIQPDVVLVHSYFGVDTIQNIRPILKRQQERGLIVIEDITQTLHMKLDFHADYYVMSLRKWMGIPDGGLLLSKKKLEYKPHFERTEFVRK